MITQLSSGKHTKTCGKSSFCIGKSSINAPCSTSILVYPGEISFQSGAQPNKHGLRLWLSLEKWVCVDDPGNYEWVQ